ncbi:MAG TPA: antitoxin Xre/MbcA/ParS toxin-binding domain-containing protein [Gammaproteobacteria bacterium]|nr:antitoxin Xre/MbcA/ParS toxin-binding domain-containing protein [Gammaproteobacteria bacterium]
MEIAANQVAVVLGLKTRRPMSKFELAERLAHGLGVSALDRLCREIAPEDASFALTLIPRATLQRRRAGKVFTPEESELLGRIARVWVTALDVYKEAETARRFLHEPHALLHGRKPIEVAQTNALGAEVVEDILGRLKYGSAA